MSALTILKLIILLLSLASSAAARPKSPRGLIAERQEKCLNKTIQPVASHWFGLIREYDEQSYDCIREPSGWRWLYTKELGSESSAHRSKSRVLVKEDSLDARLSNVLYTANSARLFYTDMHRFNSGIREKDAINMDLVAGSKVNHQQCALHLEKMLTLAHDLRRRVREARDKYYKLESESKVRVEGLNSSHIQLARVLDALGTYEHGHLTGRAYSIGAYEQCVTAQLELPALERQQVPMRYCWAHLSIDSQLDDSLATRIPLVEMERTMLKVGVCLPESCHSKSYTKLRDLFQKFISNHVKLPEDLFVRQELQLESIFCLVDEDSPSNTLGLAGKALLILAAIWLTLVVLASRWEPNLTAQENVYCKLSIILSCFDLKKIMREYIKVRESSELSTCVDFNTLIPIRIFLTLGVIYHHSFVYSFGNSSNQLQVLRDFEPGPEFDLLLYITFGVDLFLIFTSMLVSFKLVRETINQLESGPGKSVRITFFLGKWLRLVLLRAARTMPNYLLLFWFKKSIWVHLSNGPMWDKGFNKDTPTGCCLNSSPWWSPFAFNFDTENVFKKCAAIGWYVGVDLFNYAVYTPLIMLYAIRPKLSIALSTLVVSVCAWLQTNHCNSLINATYLWEVDSTQTHGQFSIHNSLSRIYVLPHYRLVFSLMGMFAGICLYEYETKATAPSSTTYKIKSKRTKPKQCLLGTPFSTGPYKALTIGFLAPLALATSCLVIYQRSIRTYLSDDYKNLIPNTIHLTYLARMLSCITLTMIFTLMVTDWRNCKTLQLLSSPFWQRISKLSCLIYLFHLDLILAEPALQTTVYSYSRWRYIYLFGATTFYSLVIAFVLHLLFEIPISFLVGLLSRRSNE